MPAPTRPRCGWRSGCAAIIAGSRTTARERSDGRGAADAASYVIAAPEHESEAELDGFTPVIIAELTTTLKRLSVSDAVTELDMTGAPSVFRHAAHGGINVVYRRADGHFGWIDPLQLFRRMPIDALIDAPYGPPPLSMIPKNGHRFSEKIMLK